MQYLKGRQDNNFEKKVFFELPEFELWSLRHLEVPENTILTLGCTVSFADIVLVVPGVQIS